MSDETDTTTEPTPTTAEAHKGGESGTYTPPASQEEFDKIIADRLTRERAKFADYDEIKTKASEYDKVVEANKTEAQKQAERTAALEAKVAEYETREQIAAWAKEVSTETGVAAELLRGSTREELLAHAEQIKPLIESANRGPVIPTQGSQPTITQTASADEWLRGLANS